MEVIAFATANLDDVIYDRADQKIDEEKLLEGGCGTAMHGRPHQNYSIRSIRD